MPEAQTQVQIGYGTVVRIGRDDGGTTTWTQLYGIETADIPSQPPEDIDATHMQSPGRTRETIPGLKSTADYTLEKQYWPADPGDILLRELHDLTSAGTKENILLEITPVGDTAWTYDAYVNEFIPTATVDAKQMANVNFKVMGQVANA